MEVATVPLILTNPGLFESLRSQLLTFTPRNHSHIVHNKPFPTRKSNNGRKQTKADTFLSNKHLAENSKRVTANHSFIFWLQALQLPQPATAKLEPHPRQLLNFTPPTQIDNEQVLITRLQKERLRICKTKKMITLIARIVMFFFLRCRLAAILYVAKLRRIGWSAEGACNMYIVLLYGYSYLIIKSLGKLF